MSEILRATGLEKSFPTRRNLLGRPTQFVHAVQDVDLTIARGETLGLVGESGSGKSTTGRLVLRLIEPDQGEIRFDDEDVLALDGAALRALRSRARMVFQDPYSSLDPRMTVGDSVGEPLTIHRGIKGIERRGRVEELFARVGLNSDQLDRYPYEFSGGQLQRMAVARAIATDPDLIVCDEPVAALDMSIRAQVINLLQGLQDERGIAYLFISHDLSLVRLIAPRLAVMYKGRVVEEGPTAEVFDDPHHPYTRALIAAIPVPDPERRRQRLPAASRAAGGDGAAAGCAYRETCPEALPVCGDVRPVLASAGTRRRVACHLFPASTPAASETARGHD
jgi:oligopeptide/dipeptide ABC transporter ATP-binding protein